MNSPFPFTSRTLLLNVSFSSHILRISLFTFDRSRPLYSGNRFPIVSNSYCYWNCLKNSDKDNKIICYFLCLESISVHFLLASRICYFLCLETKKVTKENSRLQSRVLGIGATVFQLAHAIQLPRGFARGQTVLLTKGHRSKPQNNRYLPIPSTRD